MSRPDFVQFLLDTLDAGWSTANFDPEPVFIDNRDSERQDTSVRSRAFDLDENNAVSVGSQPTTTNQAIGTEFDYRYEVGVTVRIEALHEAEHGHVASAADYGSLVGEVRRLILAERTSPTTDPGVCWLTIEDENDLSNNDRDYFRVDLSVLFIGYEDLP